MKLIFQFDLDFSKNLPEYFLRNVFSWADTPVQDRSKILMKIADILESRLDEFADIESKDQGKPLWLSKSVDIPRAVHNFRFFATSALHDLNR